MTDIETEVVDDYKEVEGKSFMDFVAKQHSDK